MSKNTKPSGIGRIGNIPVDWEVKPAKYILKSNQKTLKETTRVDYSFRYIDIASVDFDKGIIGYEEMNFDNAPSRARRIVRKGDTIISTVRTYLKAIARIEDDKDVIVSTGFSVLSPKNNDPVFIEYYCKSDAFCLEIEKLSYGIAYPAITESVLINIKIILPPLKEQQAIAAFLDAQCGHIDSIIVEMEQQIEVLKQYKTSLITETVTKGLNETVLMEDSGIEWIGKMPAHWKMGRIKYCYDILLGKMLQPFQERSTDREMNYMCSANITWDGINLSVLKQMWFSPPEIRTYFLRKGDLLVVEGGDVAIASIWDNEVKECCIQNALHLIRENGKYSNRFLYYWLYFLKHNGYIDLICNKATITHFTKEKFVESPFCIMPLIEQDAISDYLDVRIKRADGILLKKHRSIETMRAYKKSLIYEYVTGKKRVKGYQ
jgi:type I restriction enzyme S subunit